MVSHYPLSVYYCNIHLHNDVLLMCQKYMKQCYKPKGLAVFTIHSGSRRGMVGMCHDIAVFVVCMYHSHARGIPVTLLIVRVYPVV